MVTSDLLCHNGREQYFPISPSVREGVGAAELQRKQLAAFAHGSAERTREVRHMKKESQRVDQQNVFVCLATIRKTTLIVKIITLTTF